ncbi:MAG: heavy metal translocating P-type ATPase [Oscillospiraceae bacterium]|nr:heavy metal translocating P-type ATPase [Oscillospiraceae bacterium]
MKEKFNVTGMSCAACTAHVEKAVRKLTGVTNVEVSLMTNSMTAEFEGLTAQDIVNAVTEAGYGCSVKGETTPKAAPANEKKKEAKQMKLRLFFSVGFLLVLMYVSMGSMLGAPLPPLLEESAVAFAFTQFLLTLPIMYLNRAYYIKGFTALIRRSPNMDSLIAVGSAASVIYGIFAIYMMCHGINIGDAELVHRYHMDLYFEGAGMILTLITVGKYLESRSKAKTAEALTKLIELAPDTATVERDGKELTIPTSEIMQGDICVVRPGQRIPADGVIIDGSGAVDESALTGESVPVEKTVGDAVLAASVNSSGFIRFRADKVGEQTTLSQIITLVSDAGASKAPIARIADKISGIFVPVVMSIAALTFIVWLILGYEFTHALSCGISVLVISCPCALGLATPVAIMAGTGKGAENGILIKSASALETLHSIDTVVLDKTGTITEGRPSCTDIIEYESGAFAAAYAIEKLSEHPVSAAITEQAEKMGISAPSATGFEALFGRGVTGIVNGRRYYVGNTRLMTENSIDISAAEADFTQLSDEGKTVMYIADDKHVTGIVAAADVIKPSSPEAINRLKAMGIDVVMLTGDNRRTAEVIREQAGVDEVIAEVLPTGKAEHIDKIKAEGKRVAMIGDGINDAPALAGADVGIAIGAGTDIAIESADIVLMKSDLCDAAAAVSLGRATIRNIKQNLFWAFFYNAVGIPLAAGVLFIPLELKLNPMIAAAAMSLSSLFVVTNALRLRFFKVRGVEEKREPAPIQECNAVMKTAETSYTTTEENTMTKTMIIEGMMCKMCKAHVEKALNALDGASAEVILEEKKAVVTLTADISDEVLTNAVTEAGYEVISIS